MRYVVLVSIFLALEPQTALPQTPKTPALYQAAVTGDVQSLRYDIVSIKKSPYSNGFRFAERPGGLSIRSLTLKQLVQAAWGFTSGPTTGMAKYSFVEGGPKWTETEYYDIEARCDEETTNKLRLMPAEQKVLVRQNMLKQLLGDRFALRIHRETRIYRVYAVEVAKGGSKLQSPKHRDVTNSAESQANHFSISNGALAADDIQMASLVAALNNPISGLQSLVVDKTGLQGRYQIDLKWDPFFTEEASINPENADNGPTLPMALQDQLGLKLNHTKAHISIVVLDGVTRPTPN
jgi:uncharacterized protein (TIGR03435 family)